MKKITNQKKMGNVNDARGQTEMPDEKGKEIANQETLLERFDGEIES